MTELQDRPNPSGWAELLARSLPLLDHVFGATAESASPPSWTLGGGTAIALRIAHRVSDDIDIFVGATDLRAFTPMHNPHAAALAAGMQFPGNYLRFQLAGGEIDFLPGPLLSSPGFTWETFCGRPIALQTCEEVILKKVRYRAASFKARDAFDLAAVWRINPDLGSLLVEETGDRLEVLLAALARQDAGAMGKANIRPLPGYEDHLVQAADAARTFLTGLIG